ncbi:D-amino acid dehydrogenase [Orrella sp. JC864]|uniref:D-amino acid dehydrogenase n=1 Tax=Orrella sp. JC864 TaxID=3120298 RepID=UPI00300A1072
MHVCVIGAGVVGVTTAYFLAREGHCVTLVDARAQPAEVASYANGGQLSYSYVAPLAGPGVLPAVPGWLLRADSPLRFTPRLDPQQWCWALRFVQACTASASQRSTAQMLTLSYLSRDTLHALLEREPLAFGHQRNGKLIVYRTPGLLEKARALVAYQAGHGARQQVLDARQCLAREPALAALEPQLAGGIYTAGEESGDCMAFTRALFERLRALPGATVRMNTAVQRLKRLGGRIVSAQTGEGGIEADAYVVATGLGSRDLLRPLGQNLPLYGLKGYSLSVPLAQDEPGAPAISVTDYERRIVYARLGNVLRIAAMVDMGVQDSRIDPRRIALLKRQVREVFPRLDLDQALQWAGVRPATPHGKPLIGACRAADNVWINAGHGALGFTLACGSAALLADLMAGRRPAIDPAPFAP